MKPFAEPGFTPISNAALDRLMPVVSPSVWKLICAILRKTRGWHKEDDRISYSQLEISMGMSRASVAKAVDAALYAGYIVRVRSGREYYYRINNEYELDDLSLETKPVQNLNRDSLESKPRSVQNLNTQNKRKKQRLKEKDSPPEPAVQNLTNQQLMVQALSDVTIFDLSMHGARLGRTASRLIRAGYTPDVVLSHYGKGCTWYLSDWRGQKGDPPSPEQVAETIKKFVAGIQPRGKANTTFERNKEALWEILNEQ